MNNHHALSAGSIFTVNTSLKNNSFLMHYIKERETDVSIEITA